jgi:hypothetical protein
MSLYESNYLRLLNLIPELDRIDGCFRSRVAGDCDLHVEILERCRYTITLSLTYKFATDDGTVVSDPDMQIRAYLDGQLAEVLSLCGDLRYAELQRLVRAHRQDLDERWEKNVILNKWLEYLIEQGHLVLQR